MVGDRVPVPPPYPLPTPSPDPIPGTLDPCPQDPWIQGVQDPVLRAQIDPRIDLRKHPVFYPTFHPTFHPTFGQLSYNFFIEKFDEISYEIFPLFLHNFSTNPPTTTPTRTLGSMDPRVRDPWILWIPWSPGSGPGKPVPRDRPGPGLAGRALPAKSR